MRWFLLLLVPAPLFAHTRWFADGTVPPIVTNEPTALYLSIWAIVCAVVVAAGISLERQRMLSLAFLLPRTPHQFERAGAVFSMVAGAFLVIAGTHHYLFSPNLSVESGVPMWLITLQVLIGLSFLVRAFARISALVLGALWMLAIPIVGIEASLENIWVLSTAIFILITGNDYFSLVKFRLTAHLVRPYHDYALPILRIGTGATLLVLGFSEKILKPELGLNFLAQHDWNFMALLGVPYSDYLFTLSAGSVEALFGLVFILGVVTRLNALVVAVFFTIPLFLLGPIELAGHLPHFAAVVLLLFFGSGERLTVPYARRRV
jgi:uncharacterized membrane protein YphA (DoxX/SURF4 family)